MAWVFTIFLLAWPALEIAAFVEVSRWIGLLGAVAGIVLSGLAGTALMRVQGLATARRAQMQLNRGELPVGELFDGACLAMAGLLLILPGFLSDLVAFALILPPVRHWLRHLLAARLRPAREAGAPGSAPVIEGEWVVVEKDVSERRDPPNDPSDDHPRLPR